jgi:hypothetical protein
MLTKIFFTIVVIVIVALVFRTKTAPQKAKVVKPEEPDGSLSVRTVAYIIIVGLVVVSSTIFYFKYQSDNKIINIRIISDDGTSTVYQAHQKSIKGRQFETLDHRKVTLGESDRIEMEDN